MALVKCRECGKTISNEALSCPHCGAPGFGANAVRGTPTQPKKPTTIGTLPGLLIAGAALWLIVKLFGGLPSATPAASPATHAASEASTSAGVPATPEQMVAD